MRVLSVIHFPTFGGPHNRNAKFAPALAAQGIDVLVLLPDESGDAARRMRDLNVEVTTLPLGRLRATADPRLHLQLLMQFRSDVRRLRAVLRARAIDVVLVNGL